MSLRKCVVDKEKFRCTMLLVTATGAGLTLLTYSKVRTTVAFDNKDWYRPDAANIQSRQEPLSHLTIRIGTGPEAGNIQSRQELWHLTIRITTGLGLVT